MGRSTDKEKRLSEQRKYRSWTAEQKVAIRAGRVARRSLGEGGLPRARDLGHALLLVARQAAGGRSCRVGGEGGAGRRAGAAPEGPRAGAGAGSEDLRARDRGGSI